MDINFDFLELSDGKLLTNDGWTFQVHKIILVRYSEYFRALFCGINKDKSEFMISGVKGEILSDILSFIYTGSILITEENVVDLLTAADYLLLENMYIMVKKCIRGLTTDVNCLKFLKAAYDISDKETYEDCFRFAQTRFEWIMQCEKDGHGLVNLPFKLLGAILNSKSLYVLSERTVWLAIVEWTKNDMPHRLSCVPQLLLSLAIGGVDESLAEEILHHEIITYNDALLKDLNALKLSSDFINSLQIFSSLLCNRLSYILKPCYLRIPLKMHVVYFPGSLYVTYDENIDLWNKISEVDFELDFLRVIGHNLYTFTVRNNILVRKFDLIRMEWETIKRFRLFTTFPRIVTIDHYVYVLGANSDESFGVEGYDTRTNRWFHVSTIREFFDGLVEAVSIEKKIYVVGKGRDSEIFIMHMFDTDSKQWSLLPSPNIYRPAVFALVECHQKLYLIGGNGENYNTDKAEVYDPATNIWEELPDIPHKYDTIDAKVLNGQILTNDGAIVENNRFYWWNCEMERWEELKKTSQLEDFMLKSLMCTIDDAETIKIMTNRNRDPNIHLQQTSLDLNN